MPPILSRQNQLRQLVVERRKDADTLFRGKRYNGSVYMVGYAVECAFKAAVCRQLSETRLRAVLAVHDLDVLAGRSARRDVPRILLWERIQATPSVMSAFTLISEFWTSELRYETRNVDRQSAEKVLNAATQLTEWLGQQYPEVEG